MRIELVIRRIEAADALALRDVRLRALREDPLAFGSTYEREVVEPVSFWEKMATRQATSGDRTTLLAIGNGVIVGTVVGVRDAEQSDLFGVFAMWVAPEARRHGVARRLLETVEAWIVERGGTRARLFVSDAAPDARRLYERAGFVPDHRVEASPHPGVTEHGMTKNLR